MHLKRKRFCSVLLASALAFALLCLPGALGSGALLWEISDTLNALMAIPNLISILLLSGTAARICRDYFGAPGMQKPRP